MNRPKKACEFCSGEYELPTRDHRNGYCLWIEVYPFNGHMAAIAQANDECGDLMEDYIEIPMNFCPNCGRKLT